MKPGILCGMFSKQIVLQRDCQSKLWSLFSWTGGGVGGGGAREWHTRIWLSENTGWELRLWSLRALILQLYYVLKMWSWQSSKCWFLLLGNEANSALDTGLVWGWNEIMHANCIGDFLFWFQALSVKAQAGRAVLAAGHPGGSEFCDRGTGGNKPKCSHGPWRWILTDAVKIPPIFHRPIQLHFSEHLHLFAWGLFLPLVEHSPCAHPRHLDLPWIWKLLESNHNQ